MNSNASEFAEELQLAKSDFRIIYGVSITSSARTSRGRKFQRKKTISQRKNLPIECAQGDRPARCPNHFFAVPWW